jgi:hypothetical protein
MDFAMRENERWIFSLRENYARTHETISWKPAMDIAWVHVANPQ